MPAELTATEALGLWHRVSLGLVRHSGSHDAGGGGAETASAVTPESRDLTQRQMAILLQIYLVPPPHTVRGLAATLGVTKPVVTRALDTMGAAGLVDRERDDKDRRNVVIKRTLAGALYLETLGDLIIREARRTI
jgi:DNA-binding MarR family transcriptional regulator